MPLGVVLGTFAKANDFVNFHCAGVRMVVRGTRLVVQPLCGLGWWVVSTLGQLGRACPPWVVQGRLRFEYELIGLCRITLGEWELLDPLGDDVQG